MNHTFSNYLFVDCNLRRKIRKCYFEKKFLNATIFHFLLFFTNKTNMITNSIYKIKIFHKAQRIKDLVNRN